MPEYVSYSARVLKWSTIRVDSRTYSVPSRLIGVMVDVRLYPDHVEVYYKGHLVESMERIRGKGKARIDYRHIIGSLVRKPRGVRALPLQGCSCIRRTPSVWRTTRCAYRTGRPSPLWLLRRFRGLLQLGRDVCRGVNVLAFGMYNWWNVPMYIPPGRQMYTTYAGPTRRN